MKLPVDKILQIRARTSAGVIEAEWIGELVRCRDCKYNYGNATMSEYNPEDIVCTYFATDGQTENDYCSHGEVVDSISPKEMTWEQLP